MALHLSSLCMDIICGVVSMHPWLPAASAGKSNYSRCAPGKQFAAAPK